MLESDLRYFARHEFDHDITDTYLSDFDDFELDNEEMIDDLLDDCILDEDTLII